MKRHTLKSIHKVAAICALILIATFQVSTIVADFFATAVQIAYVKSAILMFIPLLILSMIATGITANKLYPNAVMGIFKVKQMRLKIAAINGMLILLPAAILLARWSESGQFDNLYWTIQILEIIAGLVNLTMIGLNIRDGIRLGRRASLNAPI